MVYKRNHKNQMIQAVAGSVLLLGMGSASIVYANTITTSNSFMDALKNTGITVGGWIQGGATYNPSQVHGFNGPVTFSDQANRFQLNQLNFFVERAVRTEGKSWDIGFPQFSNAPEFDSVFKKVGPSEFQNPMP